MVLNGRLMALSEKFVTSVLCLLGCAVVCGTYWGVYRIAKLGLWVWAPVIAYMALVPGLWNGIVSDFDYSRGEALRHGSANAHALQHMTPRGLYISCQDKRIELTEDGKAYCALVLGVRPGERIPGSEHVCGGFWGRILGTVCFYFKVELISVPG